MHAIQLVGISKNIHNPSFLLVYLYIIMLVLNINTILQL